MTANSLSNNKEQEGTISKEAMGERFAQAIKLIDRQQKQIAELVESSPQVINSYIKGRAIPSAPVMLRFMQNFPQVNWFFVVFGEGYGTLTSAMPIAHTKERELSLQKLRQEVQHLKEINELQRKSIADKERIIRSLEK